MSAGETKYAAEIKRVVEAEGVAIPETFGRDVWAYDSHAGFTDRQVVKALVAKYRTN